MPLYDYGRAFMGMTLAFHIAIALFGVGIPFMISLAEFIGVKRGDQHFLAMARRWTFAMATLFVSGALSGTVVAVTFAVLLPPFMAFVSKVVILPFFMETFAFFVEAIFLGIYAFGWDKFKSKWGHWLTSLPIVIASAASAFLITTVNSFMNAPQGFTDSGGVIANVNQWAAMFNSAVPTETSHSILAYYATTAFVFAAVAAFQFLRNRATEERRVYYKKFLTFSLVIAFVFSLAVAVTGDASARYLAKYEPEKFAAAENVLQSGTNVPIKIGGILQSNDRLGYDISIPGFLSDLVGGTSRTFIRGLDSFNPSTWPPLFIHYFFDGMVLIGMLMAAVPLLYFALRKFARTAAFSKFMMWLVLVTGFLSAIGVELGWMLAEIGRQPYTIRGIMLTSQAFTTSHTVVDYAVIFPIFYLVLSIVTVKILVDHYRQSHD